MVVAPAQTMQSASNQHRKQRDKGIGGMFRGFDETYRQKGAVLSISNLYLFDTLYVSMVVYGVEWLVMFI